MTNEELVRAALEKVGGKSNVLTATNCMTRLRVRVKDDAKIDDEGLKAIEGVMGIVHDRTGYVEIVVGPGKCRKCADICRDMGIPADAAASTANDWQTNKAAVKAGQKQSKVKELFKTFGDIFIPLIPGVVASGLCAGINSLIGQVVPNYADIPALALISTLLGLMNTCFLGYLTAWVGYRAAEKFGGTPILGGMLGMITGLEGINKISSILGLFNEAVPLDSILRAGRGGVLAVVVLLAILRGLRGVARLMQWIVPFMALLWIATSLLIGLWHITALPTIFATIFRCAFGWQEAAAGAVGYTISQALTSGFQRGMFSNEAGMGSSPNAAAAAASWPPHPAAQGIVQMIGVFIDTIVICTASAIIVMLAPRPDNEYTLNGIQDLQHAMSVLVGGWGAGFIALIVLLFAFSSIVANYVYAENNLVFLRLDKPRYIWGLRILTVLMVLLGTMVSLPVVWQSADIIMALMAMTNLTAILLLSPTVRIIASDYLRQRRLGIQPTFDATRYPDIDQQLAPGAWNELPRE